MTEINREQDEIENPETRYERRDLSPHGVLLFLVGLAVVSVLIYFVLWGFYGYLNAFRQQRVHKPMTPLQTVHDNLNPPTAQVIQSFPQPRLQANEVGDMSKFRAQEEEILNSYGWVDQQAGVAHIPIEQAIDILAAHGLPVRQGGETPVTAAQAAQEQRGPTPGPASGASQQEKKK